MQKAIIGKVANSCRFEEMQKARHRPSSRIFRLVIYGFAVAGDMRKALEILDTMRRTGCIPAVETYNVIILGLVRKQHVFLKFSCFTFIFVASDVLLCFM